MFLEQLREVARAPTINLALEELPGRKGGILTLGSIGLDPAFNRSYNEYYGERNPALVCGAHLFRAGQAYRDEELCPQEELYRTEFYNDWIAQQGMSHALFGAVLKTKRLVAFANLVRYKGAPPFDEDDLDLLRLLNPHLLKAVQPHLTLAQRLSVPGVFPRHAPGGHRRRKFDLITRCQGYPRAVDVPPVSNRSGQTPIRITLPFATFGG